MAEDKNIGVEALDQARERASDKSKLEGFQVVYTERYYDARTDSVCAFMVMSNGVELHRAHCRVHLVDVRNSLGIDVNSAIRRALVRGLAKLETNLD